MGGKQIKKQEVVMTERVQLAELLQDVEELTVMYKRGLMAPHSYPNIRLISDWEPDFIQYDTWREGDEEIKQWYNVAISFYIPQKRQIVPVAVHNCWTVFTKPQQANIVSWFKEYLAKHDELNDINIPLYLKKAATLVGAPLGSMSHLDVEQIHQNETDYAIGNVYEEPKYQALC